MKLRLLVWFLLTFCEISCTNLDLVNDAELITTNNELSDLDLPEKRALNILFFVSSFPVISETFILNQITGLLDRGCNVFIYALRVGDFKVVHQDYHKYSLAKRTIYALGRKSFKKVKSIPFDIIVCHFGPMGNHGYKLIKKIGSKAKFCTFFHGYDLSIMIKIDPSIYNNLFKVLDIAFPISDYWKNELLKLGCDPMKVVVHHMGIDTNRFSFKPRILVSNEKIKFISIARLVEKKGLKYAVKAFAQVAEKYKNIEYAIVGDGPLKTSLRVMIDKLNLEGKVKLIGWQPQEKVAQILDSSHVLLAPSITSANNDKEGIPVSIMEAMAMGIPVISTYHSGIPELVEDGVTGFLVQERDVNGLAEKMFTLISYPECWQAMGMAGRKKVEDSFELQKLNNQLLATFYEMLKGNK